MDSLTIAYITSRREPKVEWFLQSLASQFPAAGTEIIIVDGLKDERSLPLTDYLSGGFIHCLPKPTIWQGKHRITKEDWWAKSNALNTAIILCRTEWIAFVDDRCVLGPEWLQRVRAAMQGGYAVCGSYEKRAHMKVENGVITDLGEEIGTDARRPGLYPFDSWYGGSGALPLEWCLAVNGFAEMADSLGSEDSCFGKNLRNSGFQVMYDSGMKLFEDRTQGEIDGALKRSDFGESPRDWSHKLIELMEDKTTSQNPYDIRALRERVLAGEPFPIPTEPTVHWFTGTPISEMQ